MGRADFPPTEPNMEMIEHVKTVNKKIQNIISVEFIMNEDQRLLALRATLPNFWQHLLDQF